MPQNYIQRRYGEALFGQKKVPYGESAKPSLERHQNPDNREILNYDPVHLQEWQMPPGLAERIPDCLFNVTTESQFAGASMLTAVDRVKDYFEDSIHRGYPEESKTSHLARRISCQSPTVSGAEYHTPLISPAPILPTSLKLKTFEDAPHRHTIGMPSPPMTPVDSFTASTPALASHVHPVYGPDAHALMDRLSPFSLMSSDSASATPPVPQFDESAWETFIRSFEAEIYEVKQVALVRHLAWMHDVDKLRYALGRKSELEHSMQAFDAWWTGMKAQLDAYKTEIRAFAVPSIEQMKAARQARGLSA